MYCVWKRIVCVHKTKKALWYVNNPKEGKTLNFFLLLWKQQQFNIIVLLKQHCCLYNGLIRFIEKNGIFSNNTSWCLICRIIAFSCLLSFSFLFGSDILGCIFLFLFSSLRACSTHCWYYINAYATLIDVWRHILHGGTRLHITVPGAWCCVREERLYVPAGTPRRDNAVYLDKHNTWTEM